MLNRYLRLENMKKAIPQPLTLNAGLKEGSTSLDLKHDSSKTGDRSTLPYQRLFYTSPNNYLIKPSPSPVDQLDRTQNWRTPM